MLKVLYLMMLQSYITKAKNLQMHTLHYYQPPGTMHGTYGIIYYFYCFVIACDERRMMTELVKQSNTSNTTVTVNITCYMYSEAT